MVLLSPYCLKALLETLPHYLLCSSSSYRARRQVARLLAYFCAPHMLPLTRLPLTRLPLTRAAPLRGDCSVDRYADFD
jgi:hypothetical protein